ncbi:hypothetical protein P9112_013105 [Eukaryota sp. TZLM1-RC]
MDLQKKLNVFFEYIRQPFQFPNKFLEGQDQKYKIEINSSTPDSDSRTTEKIINISSSFELDMEYCSVSVHHSATIGSINSIQHVFEYIHCDTISPLATNVYGNKNQLHFVDAFSKFCILVPVFTITVLS